MADVLLVNAPVRDPWIDAHARASPPLGLASIAAVLQVDGFEVCALDLNLPRSSPESDLCDLLLKEGPRVVAFSATTESYPQAIRLAQRVKREDESILTVMGGPHVTFLSRDALSTDAVDVVVRGEGEETVRQLARSWVNEAGDLEAIRGISFRDNGSIHSNADRPFMANLDLLPLPARALFPLERYPYPGNLVTARGCPARCIFCAAPALSGGRYRARSPEKVVEEMEYLASVHGLTHCTMVDDAFTVYRQRTLRICELLEARGQPLMWGCCTRVSSVSPELLARMHGAGCREIQFGVESGSEAVLACLGKEITLNQVHDGVRWAHEAGMDVTCSFMIPHPSDTHATVAETRAMMRRLVREGVRISVAVTTPFPGTEIRERADEFGMEIHSSDWQDYDACTPVFSTSRLSRKDISLIISDLLYNGP